MQVKGEVSELGNDFVVPTKPADDTAAEPSPPEHAWLGRPKANPDPGSCITLATCAGYELQPLVQPEAAVAEVSLAPKGCAGPET